MRRHLVIFALVVTLWSLSLYFYNNPVLLNYLQWLKITILLTIITVFELFFFIVAVSNTALKKFKIQLIIFSILCSTAILAVFLSDDYLRRFHPQWVIFFLLLFVYAAFGTAALLERFLQSSFAGHLRAVYQLVGFGIFLIAITFLYVLLPLIGGRRQYFWLGPVFAIFFVLFSMLSHYITEKVQKRERAERLTAEWEKLSQTKEQLLLSLQHHLRTPLGPLKGYLEKILDGTYGREENPVIREKLIEMKKLTDTLYSLVESLLDVQELRMGGKTLNLEDCPIVNLIENIIEQARPEAEQKGLYLSFEKPSKSWPIIKADRERMTEAVWNLVDNAVKYTNRGGVTIRLRTMTEDQKLKIEIADTGIGMEKEEIDYFLQGKLFERGEQAKKLYGPGRGIGLGLALEFIKAHQGRVWAESAGWGKGTTFFIELPL